MYFDGLESVYTSTSGFFSLFLGAICEQVDTDISRGDIVIVDEGRDLGSQNKRLAGSALKGKRDHQRPSVRET